MNTSFHVVELVRRQITTEFVEAGYADVARALRVSPNTVSAWKRGENVMSLATLARAQELLDLPDGELLDLSLMLSLEASPEMKRSHAAERWMRQQAKRLPIIVIAVLGVFGAGFTEESRASAFDQSIHYAKYRRRRPALAAA